MNRRILLMGRSGCGKTSLILRVHERTGGQELRAAVLTDPDVLRPSFPGETSAMRIANKTQAAEYHSDFIDVPGEYLEVRSLYRALVMLTCESCAIALIQAADDSESLYPTGLARTFDKPVVGVVTKMDVTASDPARAEEILREAGAKRVFFTSALENTGMDELIGYLESLRH